MTPGGSTSAPTSAVRRTNRRVSDAENIAAAARAIAAADALLITAGAGMGVDSGLPDFRGDDGFWNAYPANRQLGLSSINLANPRWFDDDPHLAWGFYGHRLNLYRSTRPHAGFLNSHAADGSAIARGVRLHIERRRPVPARRVRR
jgi:hypothetical protein